MSLMKHSDLITSERLLFMPMTPAFLEAGLAGNLVLAEAKMGVTIPAAWLEETWLMQLRLDQLNQDSGLQPWLLRAIVHRQTNAMIGHIGFHGYPGAGYLQEYAPHAAELGYSIFLDHRRQGYAREAVTAMMAWASTEQGVPQFVLSISPDNLPSRRIAAHFGFQHVGQWEDEEDGPEDIFLLNQPPPPNLPR